MSEKTNEIKKNLAVLEDELNEVADNIVAQCTDYFKTIIGEGNKVYEIPEEYNVYMPGGWFESDSVRIDALYLDEDGDVIFAFGYNEQSISNFEWLWLYELVYEFDNEIGHLI